MPNHISVVIPTYNEEGMIEACLLALQKQTRQPNIIYIVDNNSTDHTIDIARSHDKVVIVTERLQGICAATDKGLNLAVAHNGLILRCDADCRPQHDWIETIEQAFDANPNVVAITGPGVAYDTGRIQALLIKWFYMKPYFFFVRLALKQTPLFGSNYGIRAAAWKKAQSKTHLRSHQNIHDDIDLSYHLAGSILYLPNLRMPISARPFRSLRSMVKRYIAGFRSIFIHWPEQGPWKQ